MLGSYLALHVFPFFDATESVISPGKMVIWVFEKFGDTLLAVILMEKMMINHPI